jgi:hypothetical protein
MKNTEQMQNTRKRDTATGKWAAGLVTVTVAACAALAMHARGCNLMVEPVAGNGACEQGEAYPYEMGKDLRFKKDDKGNYVPNKYYAPGGDCHAGNGIVQPELGEGPDSIEARFEAVRKEPCVPGIPGPGTKRITRKLFHAQPGDEMIRPLKEWEAMVSAPSTLSPDVYDPARGLNSFKRPVLLVETCDLSKEDCAANTNKECFCANHVDCPTREQPKKEAAKPAPKPAKTNAVSGPVCGDSKVEGREECDPPGVACGENSTCSQRCACEETRQPKPTACDEEESLKKDQAFTRLGGVFNRASERLRGIVGDYAGRLVMNVRVKAYASGAVDILGITPKCDKKACPQSPETGSILSAAGFTKEGMSTDAHNNNCDLTLPVEIK